MRLKYPVSKHSRSLGGIKCLPVTIFRNPHRGNDKAPEYSSKGIARQQWAHAHCFWSAKKRLLSGCFQGCKSKRFSGVPLSAGRQAYVTLICYHSTRVQCIYYPVRTTFTLHSFKVYILNTQSNSMSPTSNPVSLSLHSWPQVAHTPPEAHSTTQDL